MSLQEVFFSRVILAIIFSGGRSGVYHFERGPPMLNSDLTRSNRFRGEGCCFIYAMWVHFVDGGNLTGMDGESH